jgi:hypothetical protein
MCLDHFYLQLADLAILADQLAASGHIPEDAGYN